MVMSFTPTCTSDRYPHRIHPYLFSLLEALIETIVIVVVYLPSLPTQGLIFLT